MQVVPTPLNAAALTGLLSSYRTILGMTAMNIMRTIAFAAQFQKMAVVGSMPATHTINDEPATAKLQAFFL